MLISATLWTTCCHLEKNIISEHNNMKRLTTFILAILIGTIVFAQDDDSSVKGKEFKTIFHRTDGKIFISGFGGPQMAFTSIGNDFAHMMGGGGGIIVNNFFFGGYGLGLTTPIQYKYSTNNNETGVPEYSLEYSHGGFWLGFIIARRKPIHLSVSSQFGWGMLAQRESTNPDFAPVTQEPLFVISPIVELEMNLSHFFKVGIGGSTSLVRSPGISRTPYEAKDFLKPSVFVSFKFGWFN